MYEVFEQLLQKYGVSSYKVAQEAGVTQTALSNWKSGRSTPSAKTLQKIADYFGVTVDYLMTGRENSEKKESELTIRDRKDIAKDLDRIMEEIVNNEDGPLYYNGEPIADKKINLLRNAIEVALEDAKKKNKETYRPYKYKARPQKGKAPVDGE